MTRMLQSLAAAAATFSILVSSVAAQSATSSSSSALATGDCYSSIPSDFDNKGEWTFQTSGYCLGECGSSPYFAITAGSTCYCGNELPPSSAKVSSSNCNTPCQGYSPQTCGGTNFYQLYENVVVASGSAGTSFSQSTAKPQTTASSAVPSVVTQSGRVVTVTAASQSGSGSSSGGGGSSKVGIAVGVVVGILAIASIVGGLVLFMKRRRRLAIEEDHRRNATVSNFVNGGKTETSSATDSRLDPAFSHHRRNSLGSIADEQDFSRRILQVRNPDRESKASNMA